MFGDIFDVKWVELWDVFLRAIVSLVTLFLVTKMLGKKQVSQLSLFDYVIGISIGNFAAEMTINLETNYLNGIFAVVIFGAIAYLISYITMKSIVLRRFFIGIPTVLIQHGKLLEKNMKKVKFDINDLLEGCRTAGYFNLEDVEYAVLEVNGVLSILPKVDKRPVTVGDMQLKVPQEGLCANVVIDGKIMKQNLDNIHKDQEWLLKQLKVLGYQDIDKILLATVDIHEKVVVYERNVSVLDYNVFE